MPDGKAPKGTIRLKEDRVFVVDDQLFYLWEEKIGRPRVDILPIPDGLLPITELKGEKSSWPRREIFVAE